MKLKIIVHLIILFCLTSPILKSQTQFKSVVGGTQRDEAWSIVQTSDGGYAIAGYSFSFSGSSAGILVSKFNSEGMNEWTKSISGANNDFAYSIIQTTDGGFAVAGYTYAFGDITNMLVVKLDATGDVEWNKVISGFSGGQFHNDQARSIIETSDGGFLLAGHTQSFTNTPPFGTFFYLVKLDSDGELLWNKVIGGPHNNIQATPVSFARSVIETEDGGFAVAGFTFAYGLGNYSMYLVKLDENGDHQWSRTIGGAADDRAYSLIQTSDRGFALAGQTGSFAAGGGYTNVYVAKLDLNGNLQWTSSVGGTFANNDNGYSIIQTDDDGYAVAGFTTSFGNNMYLVKLSETGELLWTRAIGGSSSDIATSIIRSHEGGFAIAGYTFSYGPGLSWPSMMIIKLDELGNTCGGNSSTPPSIMLSGGTTTSPNSVVQTVSTNLTGYSLSTSNHSSASELCLITNLDPVTNQLPASFSLKQNYPNPFNPVTKIEFDIALQSTVVLSVYDQTGRKVKDLVNEFKNPGSYSVSFDASGLTSGVYFYRLSAGEFVETRRLVLLK